MEFQIVTGERRPNPHNTIRTYCWWATPTGGTSSLSLCPTVKLLWLNNPTNFSSTNERRMTCRYNVIKDTEIAMKVSVSSFGRPRIAWDIRILVAENEAKIKVICPGEFYFEGRGKILNKLPDEFSLEVLEAPKSTTKSEKKGLIF